MKFLVYTNIPIKFYSKLLVNEVKKMQPLMNPAKRVSPSIIYELPYIIHITLNYEYLMLNLPVVTYKSTLKTNDTFRADA